MATGVSRRRVCVGAAGIASAGGSVASGLDVPSGQRASPGGRTTPATVTLWDGGSESYKRFLDAWLPGFQAEYPQVTLDQVPRPPDFAEKLIAAIAAGTPPDVVAVFGSWYRRLQEDKQVVPLDGFIKTSRLDVQDFLQGVYKWMKWQGQQVGIPQYVNTNTVYYNRERFKQAGVPFPTDDWTADQFLETARRLTRGPLPQREVWGLYLPWGSIALRADSLLWGQCGSYNPPDDPNVFTFTTPQNVKAFQWLHDLAWRHRVGAVTADEMGGSGGYVLAGGRDPFFRTGTVAMLVDGTHLLATYKTTAQTDWDVAALPKGPCGRGEYASVDGYVIPKGAKAPEAAWAVIQGLTGKEANRLRSEFLGLVPARKSQMDHWATTIPGKSLKSAVASDAARPDSSALWPRPTDVVAALTPVWEALFVRNERTVPDALKQMQDAIVGVLGPAAVR